MFATFFIPSQNVEAATGKLDKLARKAAKLGLPAIAYAIVKSFAVERMQYNERTATREAVMFEYTALTIQGEAPKLGNWHFYATIEHTPAGNFIRGAGDDVVVPTEYRTADPTCDHCGLNRDRKETFVVKNADTGEIKRVGRQCLKDFLGHKSPEAIARYFQLLTDFFAAATQDPDELGWGSGAAIYAHTLTDYLAQTAAVIDEEGWMSRSKARDQYLPTASTADIVTDLMPPSSDKTPEQKAFRIKVTPSEAHYEEAKKAIEWIEAHEGDNDYIHNCKVVAGLGYVTGKSNGIAASILASYRREMDYLRQRELEKGLKATTNEHVGEIGKRSEMVLTLLHVKAVDSDWEVTFIHKFMDADGRAVTWFGSNNEVVPVGAGHQHPVLKGEDRKVPMVKGATYRVKATVKKHDVYQGQAQTVVNRLTVQPLTKVKKARRKKAKATEVTA